MVKTGDPAEPVVRPPCQVRASSFLTTRQHFIGYRFTAVVCSVPSQQIGWEERQRNDAFCVGCRVVHGLG